MVEMEKQADLIVQGQPALYSKFQNSQDYIVNSKNKYKKAKKEKGKSCKIELLENFVLLCPESLSFVLLFLLLQTKGKIVVVFQLFFN